MDYEVLQAWKTLRRDIDPILNPLNKIYGVIKKIL